MCRMRCLCRNCQAFLDMCQRMAIRHTQMVAGDTHPNVDDMEAEATESCKALDRTITELV